MIEVEIKAEISSPDTIRKKFLEKNGIYKISLSHEDTYFNMPRKLRDFRKTDEALRIRKSI
ncbi:MAG: CYTH domain-containing protein, partial [Candidatus Lokiarchaeota archaeon]|nr:CYTH domain-containing protein [Candidatus Lokiarchaeota archaeon]